MEIKKGDRFVCIKDLMNYTMGAIYISEEDGFITDDNKNTLHGWDSDIAEDFFKKLPRPPKQDPTVQSVIKDLNERSQLGIKKYGTTLSYNNLTHKEWLQHAYEEALDMALYIKRAMEELKND